MADTPPQIGSTSSDNARTAPTRTSGAPSNGFAPNLRSVRTGVSPRAVGLGRVKRRPRRDDPWPLQAPHRMKARGSKILPSRRLRHRCTPRHIRSPHHWQRTRTSCCKASQQMMGHWGLASFCPAVRGLPMRTSAVCLLAPRYLLDLCRAVYLRNAMSCSVQAWGPPLPSTIQ